MNYKVNGYVHVKHTGISTWGANVSAYINCHSTSCLPARLTFTKVKNISFSRLQSFGQTCQPFKERSGVDEPALGHPSVKLCLVISFSDKVLVGGVIKWPIFNEVCLVHILQASFQRSIEANYHSVTGQEENVLLSSWAT